jgi:2-polyprenyl-3-methyl-5-hydroxy-6-metoxy-1,4-benzoquinol methylase
MITQAAAQQIRRDSFSKPIPIDASLIAMCSDEPSHQFLINPASQNTYLYLTDYVRSFSGKWFNSPLSSLHTLDWGTGKGHVTHLLKAHGAAVTSCDVDIPSGDSSFGQHTPVIAQSGIQVVPLSHEFILPFESASFDIVISMGVLEHVPQERKSLSEIHRILRPNGLLFCFYLPQSLSWTQTIARLRGDTYHERLYTKQKVMQLLDASCFQPVDIWRRALFPKNTVHYRNYRQAEIIDQFLCEKTYLGYFATNIEFVAFKGIA